MAAVSPKLASVKLKLTHPFLAPGEWTGGLGPQKGSIVREGSLGLKAQAEVNSKRHRRKLRRQARLSRARRSSSLSGFS